MQFVAPDERPKMCTTNQPILRNNPTNPTRSSLLPEALVEKVDGLRRDKVLVVAGDESVPALLGVPPQDPVVVPVQLNVVLILG